MSVDPGQDVGAPLVKNEELSRYAALFLIGVLEVVEKGLATLETVAHMRMMAEELLAAADRGDAVQVLPGGRHLFVPS